MSKELKEQREAYIAEKIERMKPIEDFEFDMSLVKLAAENKVGLLKIKRLILQVQYFTMFSLWGITVLMKPALMLLSVGIIIENNFGTSFFQNYLLNPSDSFTYTLAITWLIMTLSPYIFRNPFIVMPVLAILLISALAIEFFVFADTGGVFLIMAAVIFAWVATSIIDFLILRTHLIGELLADRVAKTRGYLRNK